jgi:hypothetical protein
MFQLTKEEFECLRSQIVISNLQSQSAISSSGRGGRRYLPYAFTEQGVAMLSSVLKSKQAVKVNIEIMRAFVHLRQILASNAQLARKLEALEKKYDAQFKVVFDAIRQLMAPGSRAGERSAFWPRNGLRVTEEGRLLILTFENSQNVQVPPGT